MKKKTIGGKLGITAEEEERILDSVKEILQKYSDISGKKVSDVIKELSEANELNQKSVIAGFYLSQAIFIMFNNDINILTAMNPIEKAETELREDLISEIEAITKSKRPILN